MSGRALLRLAARDARRDRWRSALVVALVALPVAGLVLMGVLADSTQPTAAERAVDQMGRADAALQWLGGADAADEAAPGGLGAADLTRLRDRLPAGSELEVQRAAAAEFTVNGRRSEAEVRAQPVGPQALGVGQLEVAEGRAPETADEVAVSPALLDDADWAIGDELEMEPLGAVEVVGVVRDPEWLSRRLVLAAPGALSSGRPTVLVSLPGGAGVDGLAPLVRREAWTADADAAFVASTRDEVLAQRFSGDARVVLVVVGGLAAVEVALVAGAAFAVSVRRRQRELGLLAAGGATRRQVRASVLLTGATVGAGGAAAGVALGLLAALAAVPWLDALADRVLDGLRVDPWWLALSATMGLVAAVAGAWWPARTVARLPVRTALSGRRPTPRPARRGLLSGAVLAAAGVGVCLLGTTVDLAAGALGSLVFLVGAVGVVLGAGLVSPWLLERLGRLAGLLPVGPRLALRDAARFRTRNGPIVTAAMAGLAASVTVTTILASVDAAETARYQPLLPDDVVHVTGPAAEAVAGELGDRLDAPVGALASAALVADVDADALGGGRYAVATPEVAGHLVGPAAAQALADGQAVATGGAVDTDRVPLRPADGDAEAEPVVTLPLAAVEAPDEAVLLPTLLLPREAAQAAADASLEADEHLVLLGAPADAAVREAIAAVDRDLGTHADVRIEEGYVSPYGTLLVVVTAVGAVSGLLLVSVAIALAAAEARADLRTLTAVGADARARRSLAAGRALVLAGLGGLLAVPVGLIPAAALVSSTESGPLVVHWPTVAVVAALVPATASLGAMLGSRPSAPAGA